VKILYPMLALLSFAVSAQQTATPAPEPPKGTVVFERHDEGAPEAAAPLPVTPELKAHAVSSSVPIADSQAAADKVPKADRQAIAVTAYNLDMHLNLATGATTTRARMRVRNDGSSALAGIPLQISSSLKWQSARAGNKAAEFEQHPLFTAADHTGTATEIVVSASLAPGASIDLDLFYEGALTPSTERLEQIGAPAPQAAASDWDGFGLPSETAVQGVRGLGNVLWYPVAQPPVFLGEGNDLFEAVGKSRLRQQEATFRLRLTLEFSGTAPDAAIFCGQREPLLPLTPREDTADPAPTGIASATWDFPRLGFRTPSLLVAISAPTETDDHLLQVVTNHPDTIPSYTAAARLAQPLLSAWLGASPLEALTLLDLGTPNASPFEEGGMLALPLHITDASRLAPSMVHALTHAWSNSPEPWLSEGLATFMGQLYLERLGGPTGRDAALAAAEPELRALALYESSTVATDAAVSSSATPEHPPLTACPDPICYRTKGAAIFQMLRTLAGEDALKQTLQAFRVAKNQDSASFEALLEKTSGKDLGWFFDDWVNHDRGLPDLSIVNIAPRSIAPSASTTNGHGALESTPTGQQVRSEGGWITAIAVANDGGATTDVPVTLRTGSFTTTERLRIPAHSRATLRMLTPAQPDEVTVNDGSTPELKSSTHTRSITERRP
jgi:hypothetical protein